MSFFDQAYDNMDWGEVCCRLPGDLAVRALKRRILNLDTLELFFDAVGSQPSHVPDLKDHINTLIANSSLDDIFARFDTSKHPILFNWLSDDNVKRIKEQAQDKLSTEFKFNVAESSDADQLSNVLEEVLAKDLTGQSGSKTSSSRIRAVLEKADVNVFRKLAQRVLSDDRPEVRACVLGVFNYSNFEALTDREKTVALKAFSKMNSTSSLSAVQTLSHKLFAELRPLERLVALERYLCYFPSYRKITPFSPACSEQEFQFLLFAESIEYHDRVVKLNDRFKDITERDPPVYEEDDEEDV